MTEVATKRRLRISASIDYAHTILVPGGIGKEPDLFVGIEVRVINTVVIAPDSSRVAMPGRYPSRGSTSPTHPAGGSVCRGHRA